MKFSILNASNNCRINIRCSKISLYFNVLYIGIEFVKNLKRFFDIDSFIIASLLAPFQRWAAYLKAAFF
jgi:hypothetical protein